MKIMGAGLGAGGGGGGSKSLATLARDQEVKKQKEI